jgi:hypothetical protein
MESEKVVLAAVGAQFSNIEELKTACQELAVIVSRAEDPQTYAKPFIRL